MKNVIIIGNCPAGISASLYTVRAGIKTTIIGKGTCALDRAEKIENYYGFAEPVTGKQLSENGISQAKRLGVEILMGEVVNLGYDDNNKFFVQTISEKYLADSVIIATGSPRQTPNIKGLLEFEGLGVSHCSMCDGFFYKRKDIAVLGCCEYALSEATELLPIVNSISLITNGVQPIPKMPKEIKVITTPIKEFCGDKVLEKVVFTDGTELHVAGVFIAIGVAGSIELARKIGVITNGKTIVVNNRMATNVPGIFAAGDCTGGLSQISKAVYQGTVAGTEVVKYLKQ